MTLDEIRTNEDLTKWWDKAFHHRNFQDGIFKMLNDQHPMRFAETAPVTTSSAEKRLGMIEGYELALERLRLCAQYQTAESGMPPARFQPPDPDE